MRPGLYLPAPVHPRPELASAGPREAQEFSAHSTGPRRGLTRQTGQAQRVEEILSGPCPLTRPREAGTQRAPRATPRSL